MSMQGQTQTVQQRSVVRRTASKGWSAAKKSILGLIILAVMLCTICGAAAVTSVFRGFPNPLALLMQNKCEGQGLATGNVGNGVVPNIVKKEPPALLKFATFNSERVRNAWITLEVAKQLGLPPQARLIGFITAMQESGFHNYTRADHANGVPQNSDSLGIFQQRAGWGTPEQREDPWYAANAFFNGGAGGQPGLLDKQGWETMTPWEAAQAVQRSAFPGAYQNWVDEAQRLLAYLGAPVAGVPLPGGGSSNTNCIGGIPGAPLGFTGDANAMVPDPTGTGGNVTQATAHMYTETLKKFPGTQWSCFAQRPGNPTSDHPRGRACDITIGEIGRSPSPEEDAEGWRIAYWLQANAAALNVKYLIYGGKTWNAGDAAGEAGWGTYISDNYDVKSPTGGHYDHVHVSVTDGPAPGKPPVQA